MERIEKCFSAFMVIFVFNMAKAFIQVSQHILIYMIDSYLLLL